MKRVRVGSIVVEYDGRDLNVLHSHTPKNCIRIERADVSDFFNALDQVRPPGWWRFWRR